MAIRAVFLDISGVLYVGDKVIDGAVDAVSRLQQSDIEVRFLTNTSRQTRAMIYQSLQRMGFDCALAQIFTAPSAAFDWMQQHGKRPFCLVHPNILL